MGRHLSPRYGQVILVSGYPVLTAVNWSQHWCAISFLLGSQTSESKHRFPVVRTDGRSLGRCTVTWLLNFLGWVDLLSYGALCAARGAPLLKTPLYGHPLITNTKCKSIFYDFRGLIQCLTLVLKPLNRVSASLNKFHFLGFLIEVTFSFLSALVFTSVQDLSVTFYRWAR